MATANHRPTGWLLRPPPSRASLTLTALVWLSVCLCAVAARQGHGVDPAGLLAAVVRGHRHLRAQVLRQHPGHLRQRGRRPCMMLACRRSSGSSSSRQAGACLVSLPRTDRNRTRHRHNNEHSMHEAGRHMTGGWVLLPVCLCCVRVLCQYNALAPLVTRIDPLDHQSSIIGKKPHPYRQAACQPAHWEDGLLATWAAESQPGDAE